MNRLPSVIGKAPSELPWPDLLTKLRGERERVRRAIELFRSGRKVGGRTPKKKGPTTKDINRLMQETGLTIKEVNKFLAKMKEEKNG